VTIVSGWGGAFALAGGEAAAQGAGGSRGIVHTFALFDQPVTPAVIRGMLDGRPPARSRREDLYHVWCARCHGSRAVGAGVIADLRRAAARMDEEALAQVVREGMPSVGMPGFGRILSEDEIRDLAAYLEARAREDGIPAP
jgi:mono/diheme cytochrome c family protein